MFNDSINKILKFFNMLIKIHFSWAIFLLRIMCFLGKSSHQRSITSQFYSSFVFLFSNSGIGKSIPYAVLRIILPSDNNLEWAIVSQVRVSTKSNVLLSSEMSTLWVRPVHLTCLYFLHLFQWVVLFPGPLNTKKSDKSHHVTSSRELRSCVQMAKFNCIPDLSCFMPILQGVGFKFLPQKNYMWLHVLDLQGSLGILNSLALEFFWIYVFCF